MGSDAHYSEATRVHRIAVGNVTSADFPLHPGHQLLDVCRNETEGNRLPEGFAVYVAGGIAGVHTTSVDLTAGISRGPFKFGTNWQRHYEPPSSIADLSDQPFVRIA
jgi:hypothetical protein